MIDNDAKFRAFADQLAAKRQKPQKQFVFDNKRYSLKKVYRLLEDANIGLGAGKFSAVNLDTCSDEVVNKLWIELKALFPPSVIAELKNYQQSLPADSTSTGQAFKQKFRA